MGDHPALRATPQSPGEIDAKELRVVTGGPADTIVAIATPPGRGGVGIVRLSGPGVPEAALALAGALPPPRTATLTVLRDTQGRALDQALVLFFPEPHSFTGEHVLELHAHGGPVLLDIILEGCMALGARPARPGEFSERAFHNGKLDLSQAEAIADLIDSGTRQAARAAVRSLSGVFSERIQFILRAVIELRVQVEASIDFSDEDLETTASPRIRQGLDEIHGLLNDLLNQAYQGSLLRDGMRVVIAGQPNVGKSSLLNALSGREAAIVTDVPGTTRDALREAIQLDGLPLHVIDTAGLRDTKDTVERLGIQRTWEAIGEADAILLLVDDRRGVTDRDRAILRQIPEGPEVLLVHNKVDLTDRQPSVTREPPGEALFVSVRTGAGLDILREHLKGLMGYTDVGDNFTARRRHLDALRRALTHLDNARPHDSQVELMAEDLRLVQRDLGEITGEFTSEELLSEIFSSFCIGK